MKNSPDWVLPIAELSAEEQGRLLKDTTIKTQDLAAVAGRKIRARRNQLQASGQPVPILRCVTGRKRAKSSPRAQE